MAIENTSQYVSLLVNTGFAYVSKGEIEASQPLFDLAASIEDDDSTKLNVVLSLAMSGNSEAAENVLRKVSAPVIHKGDPTNEPLTASKKCSYLWWALYSDHIDPRDVAARLFTFLGERYTESELGKFSELSLLKQLRKRVADELGTFPGGCRSYALMKPIVEFVRGD